jgi:hypothetical protein
MGVRKPACGIQNPAWESVSLHAGSRIRYGTPESGIRNPESRIRNSPQLLHHHQLIPPVAWPLAHAARLQTRRSLCPPDVPTRLLRNHPSVPSSGCPRPRCAKSGSVGTSNESRSALTRACSAGSAFRPCGSSIGGTATRRGKLEDERYKFFPQY